jgi:outer membrane protein assembly factor BamB
LFAVGSDGFVHTLYVSNGENAEPAVAFLPPHTKPSALIWIEGVMYATTSDGCGAVANGVFAIDLTAKEKKPLAWETGDVSIAGTSGPAFADDGTLYVALRRPPASRTPTAAPASEPGGTSAVVALDRTSLKPKDWFSAPDADFNASPIVFKHKDKELVAVSGNDGRLYLLDAASPGGPDHKTPLSVSAKYTAAGAGRALATWENQGTRWILAPAVGGPQAGARFSANGPAPTGSIVAFKLVDQDGKLTLEPAWASRDLISPLAPVVVNGMVVAVSSGEHRSNDRKVTAAQRVKLSTPAVLHLLDAETGKTLWSSGTTITSFARGGVSAGGGQLHLVTYDNMVYAFGIPMEH